MYIILCIKLITLKWRYLSLFFQFTHVLFTICIEKSRLYFCYCPEHRFTSTHEVQSFGMLGMHAVGVKKINI